MKKQKLGFGLVLLLVVSVGANILILTQFSFINTTSPQTDDGEGPPLTFPGNPQVPPVKNLAESPNLTREGYPVIIRFNETGNEYFNNSLHGLNESHLRVMVYNASNMWVEAPFQIDEKGWPNRWYDGDGDAATHDPIQNASHLFVSKNGSNNYEPADPYGRDDDNTQIPNAIDYDDELVFTAQLGRQVASQTWWNHENFPYRIEFNITDPIDGSWSFMYIYYNNDTANFNYGMPSYPSEVNWDPATLTVTTQVYQTRFKNDNPSIRDVLRILLPGSDGTNLIQELDRSMANVHLFADAGWLGTYEADLKMMSQGSWGGSYYNDEGRALDNWNEESVQVPASENVEGSTAWDDEGDQLAIKNGPVRVIVGYQTYFYIIVELGGLAPDTPMREYGAGHNIFYNYMEQEDETQLSIEVPTSDDAEIELQDVAFVLSGVLGNPELAGEIDLLFGGDPGGYPGWIPAYNNTFYPNGAVKYCTFDETVNDDLVSSGNVVSHPPVNPNSANEGIADYLMVTSENDGGIWIYMPRKEMLTAIAPFPGSATYMWFKDETDNSNLAGGVFDVTAQEGDLIATDPYYIRMVYGLFNNVSDVAWAQREYRRYQTDLSSTAKRATEFVEQPPPDPTEPIFDSVTPNTLYHKNGSYIQIVSTLDATGYTVVVDFTTIDSTESTNKTATDNGNGQYVVNHTISISNTRSDGSYLIKVYATNTTSGLTSVDNSTYLELDNTAPNPAALPDALSTQTGGPSVFLNWTANPGADAGVGIDYYVLRRNGSVIDTTTDTFAWDNTLENGNNYSYVLDTYDEMGHYSRSSPERWTQAVFQVDDPAEFNAIPEFTGYNSTSDVAVTLNWTDNPGSDVDGITGYRIWRATASGGPFSALTGWLPNTQRIYWDTLSASNEGTTYYYMIETRDGATPTQNQVNSSQVSSKIDVSLTDYAQPLGLDAVSPPDGDGNYYSADASIEVDWTGRAGMDSNGLGGYNLYKRVGAGSYLLLDTLPASQKTYTDLAVSNNVQYSYIVETFDQAVLPNKANSTNTTATLRVVGPGTVRIINVTTAPTTVTIGQTSIQVNVTVSNTGGTSVELYQLALRFNKGALNTTNEYTVTGPTPSLNQTLTAMGTATVFSFDVDVKLSATGGTHVLDAYAKAQETGKTPVEDTAADLTDSWWVSTEIPPNLDNLTETTDPLELGNTATITIDAEDGETSVSMVLLEFEGSNHTMTGPVGNTYTYNSWTPSSTGVYPYTIYANDTECNWNTTSDSLTVQDTALPAFNTPQESADPLELGDTEVITINVTDTSGINTMYFDDGSSNQSMTHLADDCYRYSTWIPTSTGLNSYTIWAEDNNANWNSYASDITVEDTTPPTWDTLIESSPTLELGNNETISIDVYDNPGTGVNTVLLEYEGNNHTMSQAVNTWSWSNWQPGSTGVYPYTVWMEDNANNWNSTSGSITVGDTVDPDIENVTYSANPMELGLTQTITIDVDDLSGVNQVLFDIDGTNYTMQNTAGTTYMNNSWTPTVTNNYAFTIWAEDGNNNWNSWASSINVVDTTLPTHNNPWEGDDPIELGTSALIRINATDLSDINRVDIEYSGSNHSMVNIDSECWQYSAWTPASTGVYPYTIYYEDNNGNWNSYTGATLTVEDTILPAYNTPLESADPLELGNTEVLTINVTDQSGINTVYFDDGSSNQSMSHLADDCYRYSAWTPATTGVKAYTLWFEDNNGRWNSYASDITVEDNTLPAYNTPLESADPLQLGNTEVLTINVTDQSGINTVYFDNGTNNYSMSNLADDCYRYSTWTPTTTGVKPYTIWFEDNNGNWNSYASDITVQDTVNPSYNTPLESADPLELGNTEVLTINATDISGINTVYFDDGSSNQSMSHLADDCYRYSAWTPATTGVKPYTIWIEDNNGNWNSYASSITVQDTTDPAYNTPLESADPLELGNTEVLTINVTDQSGINTVYFDDGSSNQSMSHLADDCYRYSAWTPATTGVKAYTLWFEDNNGRWNSYASDITVQDTNAPTLEAGPNDHTYEIGTPSQTLEWNFTDLDANLYNVSSNSTATGSGAWTSGTNITLDVSGLGVGIWEFICYANDTTGNENSDTVYVTVEDTTEPTWDNLLESADPLQLGQNETISIDVYDTAGSGVNTVILEYESSNHTMQQSGSTWNWSNWQPGSIGTYPYTVYMQDNADNWNTTSGSIEVESTSAPVLGNVTETTDPLELNDTLTIQVDADDDTSVSIVFLEIDGVNYTMINTGGDTFMNDSWTPSSTAVYSYRLLANDTEDNWGQLGGSITVQDTTLPAYNTLLESAPTIELGLTEVITINVTDLSGINRVDLEFDGSNHSMVLLDQDCWRYSAWVTTTVGLNAYTVYWEDNNNNWNSVSDSITVQDTSAPTLEAGPNDFSYELGVGGQSLEWNFTDLDADLYDITSNSTATGSGVWTSGTNITLDVSGLGVGIWEFVCTVNDSTGNPTADTAYVTVEDTTEPTWDSLIESANNLQLGNNETIWIDVFDNPGTGVNLVYLDYDSNNHSMQQAGNTWSWANWQPTSTGVKAYTIWMQDNAGNWNSTAGTITVFDNVDPVIENVTYSESPIQLGNTEQITIDVFDLSNINQVLFDINGTNYTMQFTTGTTYSNNSWTPIQTGNYPYTIWAEDNNNNWNSFGGSINVIDTVNPAYNTPWEVGDPIELGLIAYIRINATDLSNISQVDLEFDGSNHSMTNIDQDCWQYSTWVPTTIGLKAYTIWIEDNNGNWNSYVSDITVQDTNAPTLEAAPNDFTYELGVGGQSLEWNFTDLDANLYTISSNSTINASAAWTSGTNITIDVSGLGIGVWEFTCTVNDTTSNPTADTVYVTVEDTIAPALDAGPNDLVYELGTPGQSLEWDFSDLAENLYSITSNSTINGSGSWTSVSNITIDVSGLPAGVWEFICTVNDTTGNPNSDTAYVTVTDSGVPVLVAAYDDFSYELGDTGNSLAWNWTDSEPNLYSITRNGTGIQNGTWSSYVNITIISIDGLGIGVWEFNCTVNDSSGNPSFNIVLVTVVDTIPPVLEAGQNDYSYELGAPTQSIAWNFTDAGANLYTITSNSTINGTGGWATGVNITLDVTGLPLGIWEFNCTVNDTAGNAISDVAYVTVVDTIAPVLEAGQNDYTYELGTPTQSIAWNFTDTAANWYTITSNSTASGNGAWTSGTNITLDVSGLSVGIWEFIITVNDTTGNPNSDTAYVTVSDSVAPSYSNLQVNPASPTTYAPSANYMFNCTWQDPSGISNVIFYLNGTPQNPVLNSGNEYYITLTDLSAGYYEYYWTATDTQTNLNNSMSVIGYQINKATPGLTLYIDDVDADKLSGPGATINITAVSPGIGDVSIFNNSNFIATGTSSATSSLLFDANGDFNITAVFASNENYTIATTMHWINITDDTYAPIFNLTSFTTNYTRATSSHAGLGVMVSIEIEDIVSTVATARLFYTTDSSWIMVSMTKNGTSDQYYAMIPALGTSLTVDFYINATDIVGNSNSTNDPTALGANYTYTTYGTWIHSVSCPSQFNYTDTLDVLVQLESDITVSVQLGTAQDNITHIVQTNLYWMTNNGSNFFNYTLGSIPLIHSYLLNVTVYNATMHLQTFAWNGQLVTVTSPLVEADSIDNLPPNYDPPETPFASGGALPAGLDIEITIFVNSSTSASSIKSVYIYYKKAGLGGSAYGPGLPDSTGWNVVAMISSGDTYGGIIPGQAGGTNLIYKIVILNYNDFTFETETYSLMIAAEEPEDYSLIIFIIILMGVLLGLSVTLAFRGRKKRQREAPKELKGKEKYRIVLE